MAAKKDKFISRESLTRFGCSGSVYKSGKNREVKP
jgi:hypothetical protein